MDISIKMEVKDNRREAEKEYEKKVLKTLETIGLMWLGNVTPLVPVATSRLVHSMTYEVEPAAEQVVMGTPVEYGPHVELGTARARAQPFLRPSIFDHLGEYEATAQNIFASD